MIFIEDNMSIQNDLKMFQMEEIKALRWSFVEESFKSSLCDDGKDYEEQV